MHSQQSIKLEFDVPLKMRDGTILYADIYRPDTKDEYPVILTRLPYNKNLIFLRLGEGFMDFKRFVRAGYAVVIQDVRGTGASEGDFYLLRSEAEDGYDTVELLASQPWCNGNIGMYGFSYFAFTPWAAAVKQPPHLKTICPADHRVSGRGEPYIHNCVFHLNPLLPWCIGHYERGLDRSNLLPEQKKSIHERLSQLMDNMQEQLNFLPLRDHPITEIAKQIGMTPFYYDWITHIDDDDYWEQLCSPAPLEKVDIPVFQLSGWYDTMASGILANYQEMKTRGGSELARKYQKLLIGPWTHSLLLSNMVGELNFGSASSGEAVDVTGTLIRWFDRWLKGVDNGITDEPPIRIFVMGDNVWRDENEWPLARTKYIKYYLHSRGHANTSSGDGGLSTEIPGDEQTDYFLYDPRNPVPTRTMGAQDQEPVEKRTDVLVYTSLPLNSPIEVTGPLEVKIYAASSAVDTDFTAKLVDVWPNGKAYNLADGIVRARYRNSISKPEFLEPGKIYEYSIDIGNTSNVFKTGHRIRLEISSSNFPGNDQNLNTGHPIGQDAEIKVALQTIYHNEKYHSCITLPIIP